MGMAGCLPFVKLRGGASSLRVSLWRLYSPLRIEALVTADYRYRSVQSGKCNPGCSTRESI